MNALRHPSRILLALVCLSGSLRAGVVGPKPLTAAIGMMQSVPAFRASVLEQVGFLGSLSALPAPSLSPFVSAVPSASDPWRVPATQLVGALAAQPQAIAAHQDDLRAALGKQGAESLMKSSARLQARASKDSGLRAQLNDLRSELDLNDTEAIQELGTRLNALFENSKSHPEDALRSAVAGADSSQKKIPVSWKLKPAAAPTPRATALLDSPVSGKAILDRDYADRFSRIPGVDSVGLTPITRVATLVEVPTGRTDVVVNFRSAEALATAKKSGSLPLFGDLRGWFTGYHVVARVNSPAQEDK
ncbi:MAG: hypothetical protein HYV14_14520 [Elusimicrobia bacterium]|nr:hypothetical protein [Elusimicrobiota bacterium]